MARVLNNEVVFIIFIPNLWQLENVSVGLKDNYTGLRNALPPRFRSFIKFGLTGASGLALDFFLTWLFKDQLHINKFIANGIGFSAAVSSNYYINRRWTFKSTETQIGKQFAGFVAVSVIGLLLNTMFIYLFNNVLLIPFYISKAMAIFFVFFWNYTANFLMVFKSPKND